MPQEREHKYPMPTAAEVDEAPGDPATKAARNIMVRHIEGIPRRAFLMGDNDHAPVLQGVADLAAICYAVIDAAYEHGKANLSGELLDRLGELRATLEHHGCPDAAPLIETPEV